MRTIVPFEGEKQHQQQPSPRPHRPQMMSDLKYVLMGTLGLHDIPLL